MLVKMSKKNTHWERLRSCRIWQTSRCQPPTKKAANLMKSNRQKKLPAVYQFKNPNSVSIHKSIFQNEFA